MFLYYVCRLQTIQSKHMKYISRNTGNNHKQLFHPNSLKLIEQQPSLKWKQSCPNDLKHLNKINSTTQPGTKINKQTPKHLKALLETPITVQETCLRHVCCLQNHFMLLKWPTVLCSLWVSSEVWHSSVGWDSRYSGSSLKRILIVKHEELDA